MNLLLIEDHKPLTRALRQALEEEGHMVQVVADADQVSRTLCVADVNTEYDVIILDLVRRHGDGRALLARWRRAGLKTPVLALIAPVAYGQNPDLLHAAANDYLTLPFEIDELLARLLRAFAHAGRPKAVANMYSHGIENL
jgi:DNA-binding response OmpR family regulator